MRKKKISHLKRHSNIRDAFKVALIFGKKDRIYINGRIYLRLQGQNKDL